MAIHGLPPRALSSARMRSAPERNTALPLPSATQDFVYFHLDETPDEPHTATAPKLPRARIDRYPTSLSFTDDASAHPNVLMPRTEFGKNGIGVTRRASLVDGRSVPLPADHDFLTATHEALQSGDRSMLEALALSLRASQNAGVLSGEKARLGASFLPLEAVRLVARANDPDAASRGVLQSMEHLHEIATIDYANQHREFYLNQSLRVRSELAPQLNLLERSLGKRPLIATELPTKYPMSLGVSTLQDYTREFPAIATTPLFRVDLHDADGKTALHYGVHAVLHGASEAVLSRLNRFSAGAIHPLNSDGETPLQTVLAPQTHPSLKPRDRQAALAGLRHVIIKQHAGRHAQLVHTPLLNGDTPLHRAVMVGSDSLLAAVADLPGIDLGAKNAAGETATALAERLGRPDLSKTIHARRSKLVEKRALKQLAVAQRIDEARDDMAIQRRLAETNRATAEGRIQHGGLSIAVQFENGKLSTMEEEQADNERTAQIMRNAKYRLAKNAIKPDRRAVANQSPFDAILGPSVIAPELPAAKSALLPKTAQPWKSAIGEARSIDEPANEQRVKRLGAPRPSVACSASSLEPAIRSLDPKFSTLSDAGSLEPLPEEGPV